MTNDDMNTQEDIEDVLKQENDKEYFESYNNISVHELMLKDKPRTLAYMHAIKNNSHLFRDKIVMDVGAGTGILSMFAAKLGGARHVYAIEASGTAHIAASVIQENGLSDVITVVQQTVESIKELPHKVDVIISEWMGFYLVHESMLDSVLVARDRFLATDGVMFPSKANIYAAAADMSDVFMEKLGFWEDVYG
jgi:protein arginine N-methyltransferase 1